MLKIFHRIEELNYGQLMHVYAQSITEDAARYYPDTDKQVAIIQAEQDLYTYLSYVFFRGKGARCAAWVCDGCYASVVRIEPYQDGLLLTGLETACNLRRKGFAKALLSEVLKYLQDFAPIKVYAHVEKCNLPSCKLHEICGFQRTLEHATYLDGVLHSDACTFCILLGRGA